MNKNLNIIDEIINGFKEDDMFLIEHHLETLLRHKDYNRLILLYEKIQALNKEEYLNIYGYLLEEISQTVKDEDYVYSVFCIPYTVQEEDIKEIKYKKINDILIGNNSKLPFSTYYVDGLFAFEDMVNFLNPEDGELYQFTNSLVSQFKEQENESNSNITFKYKNKKLKNFPLDNKDFNKSFKTQLEKNKNTNIYNKTDIRFIVGILKETNDFFYKTKKANEKNPAYLLIKGDKMTKKNVDELGVITNKIMDEIGAGIILSGLPIISGIERILATINLIRFQCKYNEMKHSLGKNLISHLLFETENLEKIVFTDKDNVYYDELIVENLPFLTIDDIDDLTNIIIDNSFKMISYDSENIDMLPKPSRLQLN